MNSVRLTYFTSKVTSVVFALLVHSVLLLQQSGGQQKQTYAKDKPATAMRAMTAFFIFLVLYFFK